MRKTLSCLVATTAAAVLQTALGVGSAAAAADTTGPELSLAAYAGFTVGTQVDDSTAPYEGRQHTTGISQRVRWSGSDASGICGYDVRRVYSGFAPDVVLRKTTATSFTEPTTDYDAQQGGGSFKVLAWSVTAHDCAGNRTTKLVTTRPVVAQEDGTTYGYDDVAVAYSGTWAKVQAVAASGDALRSTTQAGAKVTVSQAFQQGQRVALVMPKGPQRGAVAVYVDGVHRATVDTYAASVADRSIVWTGRMQAGKHTVTVENLATAGRPRVDVDAFILN